MSKVFIVTESSYYNNDYAILGVYDSLDKAKTHANKVMSNYSKCGLWKESFGTSWKNDEYEWRLEISEQEVI